MKTKRSNFDDFKRNQLTAEGKKSIIGGLPPGGLPTVPEFEDGEEEAEPQWGGPIVLSNTGGIKIGDNEIKIIVLP